MENQNNKIQMISVKMIIIRIIIILGFIFIALVLFVSLCKAIYNIISPVEEPNELETTTDYESTSLPVQEFDTNNITVQVAAATTEPVDEIILLPEVPEELRKKIDETDEEVTTPYTNLTYKLKDSTPYNGNIDIYTDLSNRMDISEYDVARCIEYMTSLDNNQDSIINNEGIAAAYIEASRQSGYDVLFLVALTGHESGWYISELHRDKWNPYSIGMYDWDPENGLEMGDTFEEGIINGANYIHKYWYDEGHTTLYDMKYGDRMYASDDTWLFSVCSIMNTLYRVVMEEY